MDKCLKNLVWLENWEKNKKYNIEVGFDDHTILKGYIIKDTFATLEELPNIDFFYELRKLTPKLFDDNEIIYGELNCFVGNKKYRIIYHYDKQCYMVTDEDDTIIKKNMEDAL